MGKKREEMIFYPLDSSMKSKFSLERQINVIFLQFLNYKLYIFKLKSYIC